MIIMNFQKAEFETRTLPFDPSALLPSSLIRLRCHFFAKAKKEPATADKRFSMLDSFAFADPPSAKATAWQELWRTSDS
jgi:hypothetical protein